MKKYVFIGSLIAFNSINVFAQGVPAPSSSTAALEQFAQAGGMPQNGRVGPPPQNIAISVPTDEQEEDFIPQQPKSNLPANMPNSEESIKNLRARNENLLKSQKAAFQQIENIKNGNGNVNGTGDVGASTNESSTKKAGQIPINNKVVITNDISIYNKSTLDHFQNLGRENTEKRYLEFLTNK